MMIGACDLMTSASVFNIILNLLPYVFYSPHLQSISLYIVSAIAGDHDSLSDADAADTDANAALAAGQDNVWSGDGDQDNELEVASVYIRHNKVLIGQHHRNMCKCIRLTFNPQNMQKRAKSGWSIWSGWSTCSRSCDGGVAQQLRRCHSPEGCRGEPIRYRLCNMQVSQERRLHY